MESTCIPVLSFSLLLAVILEPVVNSSFSDSEAGTDLSGPSSSLLSGELWSAGRTLRRFLAGTGLSASTDSRPSLVELRGGLSADLAPLPPVVPINAAAVAAA